MRNDYSYVELGTKIRKRVPESRRVLYKGEGIYSQCIQVWVKIFGSYLKWRTSKETKETVLVKNRKRHKGVDTHKWG